jgi:ABC-type transporter Mla subunit MlaD
LGKNSELQVLIEALKEQKNAPSEGMFATPKNVNVLVLGVLAAVGALVWNTVVAAPANFGHLSQQNAEIRTTMVEMKNIVSDLSRKLDEQQKESSGHGARLSALENQAVTNKNNIEQLVKRLDEKGR